MNSLTRPEVDVYGEITQPRAHLLGRLCACIFSPLYQGLLILVTTNYSNPQLITYDLSNFALCEGPVQGWETNTDDGEGSKYDHFEEAISGQSVTIYFAANTVKTLEVMCA